MRTQEQAEVYFGRCDQAAVYLMKGKKVSIHLEVLGQFSTDVKQWLVDLHNAIAVECYDPADCLEDSCSPEYKLSVLVKNGKAIASAKRVNWLRLTVTSSPGQPGVYVALTPLHATLPTRKWASLA